MPQLENDKILGRILRSTLGVVSRRTSEAYANVIIGNAIKELLVKHSFLRYIVIQGTQYNEIFDAVTIQPEINNIEFREIGRATGEFIEKISRSMGKDAGYYFIKEIKEDLPYDYETALKELGVDLDLLHLKFITELKQSFREKIDNSDVLKFSIGTLFDILDKEIGKNSSFSTMSKLVERLSTEYPLLKYVKINDVRFIQGVDVVKIAPEVNDVEPAQVGVTIQKVIQEINSFFGIRHGSSLIDRLKNHLTSDYIFKLNEIGVNLDVIQLRKELVIKQVLKALINVLSELSNQMNAMLEVNRVLRKFEGTFEYLKLIEIDSKRFSEGLEAIAVSPDIESVRISELGRGIQKIVEDINTSLGEDTGREFIAKFKKRLGKAYILRIEEMGVNLHMIELRKSLDW